MVSDAPHRTEQKPDTPVETSDFNAWNALRLLSIYRVTLASLFLVLGLPLSGLNIFGTNNTPLFLAVCALYLIFSAVSFLTIRGRWPDFNTQSSALTVVDIVLITLMMHASGGISSGLGMLLIVSIAGSALLMKGRTALLFASIASLLVLFEQLYSQINHASSGGSYTQAGLLGITIFATAIAGHALSLRLRASEALAARRGADLADMAQLTQYIIQRMQTGIVVLDSSERIQLANESSRKLLEMPLTTDGEMLENIAPKLTEQLHNWRRDLDKEPHIFRPSNTSADILPRFAKLGADESSGILIFLEDNSATAQQAQQLKLASLGRLTASIAHEIRNPLGAISHACQLLTESPHLDGSDKRLLQIILDHSKRVNIIVKNILQLSRRSRSQPQTFNLNNWIERFIEEFLRSVKSSSVEINSDINPADVEVRFDPTQLHQVLWNLSHNGLRYSALHYGQPKLTLRGGVTAESQVPFLDAIDLGPGIKPEDVESIFEPFFTTNSKGTGLGLYIARELCESNHARLSYIPVPSGGSCFRITFSDPRRKQVE
ncbi:MAG: ATPase [Gammaproteobacteria bacterium]|nr:ATPase [Gammaproteobacteria bacterium]